MSPRSCGAPPSAVPLQSVVIVCSTVQLPFCGSVVVVQAASSRQGTSSAIRRGVHRAFIAAIPRGGCGAGKVGKTQLMGATLLSTGSWVTVTSWPAM